MGRRSSGNATVLASEPGRAVPVDGDRRVVAWVRPIKRKTGAELLKAFESIVAEGRRPQTLQTDKGKEFYNTTLQRWLKKEDIRHFSTLGDAKASIVERFNRTLKSR